jgi:RHS repeat-associated protein
VEGRRTLGSRDFELSNHLGNVLTIATDNIHLSTDSTWASVTNSGDYYAYGLSMQGRTWTEDDVYRYGFNGTERDANGELGQDHYAFKYRMYNPSLGRFLTTDPLTAKYPHNSPYAFAENKLGLGREFEGLELNYFDPGVAAAYHFTYGRGDGNIGFGDLLGGMGMALIETVANLSPYGTSRRTVEAVTNYARNDVDYALNGGSRYQEAVENGNDPGDVTKNYEFNKLKAKIELVNVGVEWMGWSMMGAEASAAEAFTMSASRTSAVKAYAGRLSNLEARTWYLAQEKMIPKMLDKTATLEVQAKQAWSYRNQIRSEARELMADRAKAAQLEISDPNMTWEQTVKKYSAPGKSIDQVHKDIVEAAQRSRTSVNKSLGIKE